MIQFNTFPLPDFLLDSLTRLKITAPTPVQAEAIPPALEGKDVLATAQTGTGKTLAYLIPLITHLSGSDEGSGLILTPTRELAIQVKETILQLLPRGRHFNIALLIGGDPFFKQFSALKRRPKIIIGTPGRVCDHLIRKTLHLEKSRFFVLDEIDRMLDIGFSQALEQVAKTLPPVRQTFMFSATLPAHIVKLSQKYLTDPVRITVGSTTEPTDNVKQQIVQTKETDKFSHLLTELGQRDGSIIIFVKTKIGADRLADKLQGLNHTANAIHGDLPQRRREQIIRSFRDHKNRILVATDVAARGLDIPHIKHVINYDLPQCPEDYIHRIGRTGRAGLEGHALSFVSAQDRIKWKMIHRLISTKGSEKDLGHLALPFDKTEQNNNPRRGKKSFPWKEKRNGETRKANPRSGPTFMERRNVKKHKKQKEEHTF